MCCCWIGRSGLGRLPSFCTGSAGACLLKHCCGSGALKSIGILCFSASGSTGFVGVRQTIREKGSRDRPFEAALGRCRATGGKTKFIGSFSSAAEAALNVARASARDRALAGGGGRC